ncbi:HEPN domain-containing protein [Candidatus Gottesmanbacteria bacterium]|nr:HEPN domain-containing protein [Candidatus Gottesmanbacteria bacterium]
MPREFSELGTPQEWLKRAKSNLALAKQPKTEDIYMEDLCFETQQAAEKALKAVLLFKKIPFRFVHDLAELITLLENNGIILPEEVRNAAILTDYSVEARYPGPFEPVTKEEFKNALKIAESVVVWAENQIGNQ